MSVSESGGQPASFNQRDQECDEDPDLDATRRDVREGVIYRCLERKAV
jgi:hypothetical protein